MADAMNSGLSAVEPLSVRDAASLMGLGAEPPKDDKPAKPPVPVDEPDEPVQADEPPVEDDAAREAEASPDEDGLDAAPDEGPGDDEETEEPDDPADDDQPSIDPPRSWSKEDKELWKGLPRETQERLSERERSRESDFLRRQNEVTEATKAAQAEAQQASQARDSYKQGLDQLQGQLAAVVNAEFSDIKSWDDVKRMSNEDPVRYNQWTAMRDQARAVQAEQEKVAREQQEESQKRFNAYVAEQQAAFLEARPEYSDPQKFPQLQSEVVTMLTDDYGVSRDELSSMWNGTPVSFHDHRFQELIADALAFKKAKSKVATKPKTPKPKSPPPQKPGTPPAKGEGQEPGSGPSRQGIDALRRPHSGPSPDEGEARLMETRNGYQYLHDLRREGQP